MRMLIGALGVVAGIAAGSVGTAHAAGLPQLDPTNFSPQIVWLVITFVVLYVLMARVALPSVSKVLEERKRQIGGTLERAEALRADAEAAAEAYETALADARLAAQGILKDVHDRIATEAAARNADLGARLAAEIGEAEVRIAEAKGAAMKEIAALATEVTGAAVERLTGAAPTKKAVDSAVKATLKERAS